MMEDRRFAQHFNVVLNILVIAIVLALAGTFIYRLIFESPLTTTAVQSLPVGQTFSALPDDILTGGSDVIVLALDTNCKFCRTSVPFYKEIVAVEGTAGRRIVGLFNNNREDVDVFLKEHNLSLDSLHNVDLRGSKIEMTPTIIWLDSAKSIKGSFQGVLDEEQEKALLEIFVRSRTSPVGDGK